MRYFFITGTSRGIGKALVEKILQEEGTMVYGFSRNPSVEHKRYHHHTTDLADADWLSKNVADFFP
ncbi:MAG: NAD-dependent epimerase/dehydratase family protein, partial [bacterium]